MQKRSICLYDNAKNNCLLCITLMKPLTIKDSKVKVHIKERGLLFYERLYIGNRLKLDHKIFEEKYMK